MPPAVNPTQERSCLSRDAILRHLVAGRVFILPFTPKNLGTSQYDLRLGPHYYRETKGGRTAGLYNIYSREDIDRAWGKEWFEAEPHRVWAERENSSQLLEGIGAEERLIALEPGETILAHTIEFAGGNDNRITTKIQARSSLGRSHIEVCKCAGMGDIGFCNRWTLEVTNNSRWKRIPLVAGMRIAQLVFFETEGISFGSYRAEGKYQADEALIDMVKSWRPDMMKPKLYNDWEFREDRGFASLLDAHEGQLQDFLKNEGRHDYRKHLPDEYLRLLGEKAE